MNILLDNGDVNPPFSEGTKNILLMHAKELKKRGHNVIILTKRKSKVTNFLHPKFEEINGLKFYRWKGYLNLYLIYFKILKKEKVDLIHIFSKGLRPISYLIFLKNVLKKPVIFSTLGFPYSERYTQKRLRKTFKNIDFMLISSKSVFKAIKPLSKGNCLYFPYGIDTKKFKPTTKKNNLKKIVCLRSFPKELFFALEKINKKFPNISFIFNKEHVKKSYQQKLKKISVVGPLEDISPLLQEAELLIDLQNSRKFIPSASPPLLTLEAMACGVKVLSTTLPEIKEIIQDDKTGFLINKNSSQQIYNGILRALKSKKPIKKYARKVILRRYNIETLIPKYEKLYQKLIT